MKTKPGRRPGAIGRVAGEFDRLDRSAAHEIEEAPGSVVLPGIIEFWFE